MAYRKDISVAVIVIYLLYLPVANGHSWLACTDYAEKNAKYYKHEKCRGYARGAIKKAPRGGIFGEDKMFDYRPTEDRPCGEIKNDNTQYNRRHPMAVYYPGQQVVIAHPMKNHASDTCTNKYIPDNGGFIYRSPKNSVTDPKLSDFRKKLVASVGAKDTGIPLGRYPRPGYQNAPAFCENPDKALGTISFNVPKDLESGLYTFMWLWAFNSEKEIYSSCYEVNIVGNVTERNKALKKNGFHNTYEPCGGRTSDFSIFGNSNPGCTKVKGQKINVNRFKKKPKLPQPKPKSSPTNKNVNRQLPKSRDETKSPINRARKGVQVFVETMSAEIRLPSVDEGVTSRLVTVQWNCQASVQFWNARVVGQRDAVFVNGMFRRGKIYELAQDAYNIRQPIKFQATFSGNCDAENFKPIANLKRSQ